MKKKLFTLGLAGSLMLSAVPAAFASDGQIAQGTNQVVTSVKSEQPTIVFKAKTIRKSTARIEATLQIPVLSGMVNVKKQDELNTAIEKQALADLDRLEKESIADAVDVEKQGFPLRPYILDIRYNLNSDGSAADGGIVSFTVITSESRGNSFSPRIDAYNFTNDAEAKPITLSDLFGDEFKTTINKHVAAEIAKAPEKYFEDAFKTIADTQPFYIYGNHAYIMFNKYEIAPGAAGILDFAIASSKLNQQAVSITMNTIKKATAEVNVELDIPVISGMKDTAYQKELNAKLEADIRKQLDTLEQEAAQDAKSLKEAGEVMRPYILIKKAELKGNGSSHDDGIFSFTLTTHENHGGTGMTTVEGYNIHNTSTATTVTLEQLFGSQYADIWNKHVRTEMSYQPETFFDDDFTGINSNQTFYVKKGSASIVFQKYEISPGAMGTPEFSLPLPGDTNGSNDPIAKITVNGTELSVADIAFVDSQGNEMVQLRTIAEALGFSVTWDETESAIEVADGAQEARMQIDQDSYTLNKTTPSLLGAAPIIQDGKTYVPVSFFTNMLKVSLFLNNGVLDLTNK